MRLRAPHPSIAALQKILPSDWTIVTRLVNMIHMLKPLEAGSQKRTLILDAAIPVFGRFGFKKASVDDLAKAAKISKQGLYLHFSSKEEVFVETVKKYLDDGLGLVEQELARPDAPLFNRLLGAMDSWFGRHLATFNPASFDVIEASDRLSGNRVEEYKSAFQVKLRTALADSSEFKRAKNVCSPKEISQVLFLCGLTWKEGHASRADFMKKIGVCIRACCQIEG
jgi:TetR/AcrR family transcriptional regulator, regulator of autoinduction and epiphytic fitness